MIMRRVDNALLIDPAVSIVLEKSKSGISGVIAPNIYRSIDIQNEWGKAFNTENEIPFAGIMAGSEILKNPELVKEFSAEYKKAAKWCMAHPEETAKMIVKYIPQLNEKGVAEAMRNVILKAVDAQDGRKKLEAFFTILEASKPALIGGKMPDDNFYFGSKTTSKVQIRLTSLPAYMQIVLTNLEELNISDKQKEKLLAIKAKVQPIAKPIQQAIIKESKTIKLKSLNNAGSAELTSLSTEISNLRLQFAEIKTDCRDQVIDVLTDEQWTKLVKDYNADNTYDIGNPLGRMSPVPNYMIEVYQVDGINLSDDQTKKITGWSEKRHANSVMAHSTIADFEQEVRSMSLAKASKEKILAKVKEMEKIRHKISVTKTDCRDYMKKNILQKEQWDLLASYILKGL